MSSNILRSGFVGVDSVNFWLSTKDVFHVRGLEVQTRALSFYGSFLDQHVLLALSTWKSRHSRDLTALNQMSENKFNDIILENGDVLVILSSGEAVELHSPKVGSGAILVVAQMPLELLQQFATKLGVSFTPSEYGVYKKIFHPSEHLFTILRNELWFLYGVLNTLGAIVGRALDIHDLAAGKWRAASIAAVERLERKMGHVGKDDCAICTQSLTVIKTGCSHNFHSSCLEEWALENSDSCPLCREGITSTEHDNKTSSTTVGQD